MANLAAVLKSEVTRLARKELRAETDSLKKTVTAQRSEIAALKRRTAEREKSLKALMRLANKAGRTTKLMLGRSGSAQAEWPATARGWV